MLSDAPRQDRPATRRIREQPYMVKQIGALVPCSLVLWDCEGLGEGRCYSCPCDKEVARYWRQQKCWPATIVSSAISSLFEVKDDCWEKRNYFFSHLCNNIIPHFLQIVKFWEHQLRLKITLWENLILQIAKIRKNRRKGSLDHAIFFRRLR